MCSNKRLILVPLVLLSLFGCSRGVKPNLSEPNGNAANYEASLGTEWGERVDSRVNYVQFKRENEKQPDFVETIFTTPALEFTGSPVRLQLGARSSSSSKATMESACLMKNIPCFSIPICPGWSAEAVTS